MPVAAAVTLCPNVPELIRRNLSSLRFAIRTAAETKTGERLRLDPESLRLIRRHNDLIRLNRAIAARSN
jgi:hypothetical protein